MWVISKVYSFVFFQHTIISFANNDKVTSFFPSFMLDFSFCYLIALVSISRSKLNSDSGSGHLSKHMVWQYFYCVKFSFVALRSEDVSTISIHFGIWWGFKYGLAYGLFCEPFQISILFPDYGTEHIEIRSILAFYCNIIHNVHKIFVHLIRTELRDVN